VVLDGARGQEQPGADPRVGQADGGQTGDLGFLRGQLDRRGASTLAGCTAGGA